MYCTIHQIRSSNKWAICFYDYEYQRTNRQAEFFDTETEALNRVAELEELEGVKFIHKRGR